MAATDNKLFALLGFNCTGDVGPWTIYTSKRRQLVIGPRTPAMNPPTVTQTIMRNRWRTAAAWWPRLPPGHRELWEEASRRTSLGITGYNLWIWWYAHQDRATIATIERQSGVELLPPY